MQSIEKGVGRAANSMVSDHRSVIIEVKKKKRQHRCMETYLRIVPRTFYGRERKEIRS